MKQTKHFKRTALPMSAKSMVSTLLLLIAMLMPQGVWATDFISEVKISSESGNNGNNAKSHLTNNNYTLAGGDLNYGNGKDSWYIYLGYKTDTDASKAITGIMIVSGKDYLGDEYLEGRTKTLSYDGKTWYRSPAQGAADLNKGASGDYLTIFYTRDGNTVNSGKPLVSLSVAEETSLSGYTYAGLYKDGAFSANGSTNVGTSGAARYITYTTHTHSFNQYGICSCGFNHVPSGNGTSASPYEVEYYTDLVYLGNLTRNGNDTFHALQIKDIDCGGRDIVPLGGYQNYNYYYFKGTYDGGGHVIKNAKCVITSGDNSMCVGVFGRINSPATVKNLGVVNSTFGGSIRIAAVCGQADSGTTIDNCFALNNTITSEGDHGGICGIQAGTITNCYSDNYIRAGASPCSNCYSVKRTFTDQTVTQISADDITSGRLCYLINKGKTDGTQVWYQKLGTNAEAYPTLKKEVSKTVYQIANFKCDGKTVSTNTFTYSNNASAMRAVDAHNYSTSFITDVSATCTSTGSKSKHCTVCAAKTEVTTIAATGHGQTKGYTASYDWSGTAASPICKFTLKCNDCKDSNNNPTVIVNSQSITTSTTGTYGYLRQTAHDDAKCPRDGYTTYQAMGIYSDSNQKDAKYTEKAVNTKTYAIPSVHIFAADDPAQGICTGCNHSFLRYSANNKVVPGVNTLLNGSGQNIYHDEKHTFANGKGVIELDEPLVSIGANAFKQCLLTDNLSLPSSVESIDEGAFMGCSGLTSIMFESVPKIGNNAFNGVNCTKNMVLTYDSYLYKVEGGNPYFPEVASVTVPCDLDLTGSAVANRENYTFIHGNKIKEVDEAHYVSTICINKVYHYSCDKCHGIQAETYTVDGGTGIHIFADDDLEQSECTLCHRGFFRYTSNNNAVVKPNKAGELKDKDGKSLTIISNSNGVMEFNAPLVTIGALAFQNCTGFTGDLIIPNTVRFVGTSTFANCTGLNGTLVISRSVENVETYAFYDSNFQRVEMRSVPNAWSLSMYNLRNITVVLSNKSYIKRGSNQYFPDSKYIISVSAPCNLDLSNSAVADHENIIRTHDYRKETLTASPVENGLYAYACDGGCGTHTDDHIIKDFNGEGNHLELTKSGSAYSTTEDVTLADANGFVSPVDFTANSASYTRTGIKNQWGTIVVPFEVNGSGDEYDLYTLSSVSSDELTLTKVNGTLAAGTPALIRINSELVNGKTYDLTLTAASNAVNAQGTLEGTFADGLTLTGSYSVKDITDEKGYIISNNKFWSIQDIKGANHVKCAPFRAYLAGTLSSGNSPQMLSISWSEGTLTSVSDAIEALNSDDTEIYDINGRRISSLRPGVNIVKYANGKTVKVHVK